MVQRIFRLMVCTIHLLEQDIQIGHGMAQQVFWSSGCIIFTDTLEVDNIPISEVFLLSGEASAKESRHA
jgi:hypothetical protein